MQHLHSWFWFLTSYKRRLSNKRAPSSYERLTSKCSFHYKPGDYLTVKTLFDFLIPLAYLYWKWLVIITSKSIKHFSKKTVCFICRHSSQRRMISFSQYYTTRGGTTMNYAKQVFIFITMHIFSIRNTWSDKKAPQNTYVMCFHFFYIRTPRWNVRCKTHDFCS